MAARLLIRAALLASLAPIGALAQQAPGADAAGAGSPAPASPSLASPAPTSPSPTNGAAMSKAIVTVDQEQLYSRSAWGKRAEALVAERLRALEAENDRLVKELSAEEAALTDQRATLPAEDFRARAAAFDERVTTLRREREAASLEVAALSDAERSTFFAAAIPVIGALMRERGAVVVLDPRTVLLSAEAIDITDAAVSRLNGEIGDGAGKVQPPTVVPRQPAGTEAAPGAGPTEGDAGGIDPFTPPAQPGGQPPAQPEGQPPAQPGGQPGDTPAGQPAPDAATSPSAPISPDLSAPSGAPAAPGAGN